MNETLPYRPLFDRVLVKPIPPEEVSKGGIIIPDNAKERSQSGVVVAVGPGDDVIAEMPVVPGDVVMYGKFSGFEVGVEKLKEIAGGEIVSDTETLVVLRVQEIMLVRNRTEENKTRPILACMERVK